MENINFFMSPEFIFSLLYSHKRLWQYNYSMEYHPRPHMYMEVHSFESNSFGKIERSIFNQLM